MPPLPRLKLPSLSALERELRFAPPHAILRDIERVESLAPEIESGRDYPIEYLVFRITGFRPAPNKDFEGLAPGEAILQDLSAFAERLAIHAKLTPADAAKNTRTLAQLAERWGISDKTIERLRKKGLIARRVWEGGPRSRLVFADSVVRVFEARHNEMLREAKAFTRIDPKIEEHIIARARRYQKRLGWSLNKSAKHLAAKHNRSHEGIRQLLLRAAKTTGTDVPEGPIDSRKRKVIWRAWRIGVDPATLAKRYQRSSAAVRRAIHLRRAELLQQLAAAGDLAGPTGPMFTKKDAAEVLLAPKPVRSELGAPGAADLAALIASMRQRRVPIGAEETMRASAYCFLKFDVALRIKALSKFHPAGPAIDIIETRLLWAARLKAELLRPHLRLVLETLEARLARRIEELPARQIPPLLERAIESAAEGLELLDPFKSARPAAAIGLAVDRFAARAIKSPDTSATHAAKRAALMLPAGIEVRDWTRHLCPWQEWLEADARIRPTIARKGALDEQVAEFLIARFGWEGDPPRTLPETAVALAITNARATRLERDCRRVIAKALAAGTEP